jgi:pilus assembly protein CpaE
VIVYLDAERDRRDALQVEIGPDLTVGWAPDARSLEGLLSDTSAPVEAVVCGQRIPFDEALATAEHLSTSHPDVGVIVLAEHVETYDLRRALRAGVLDVLDDRRAPGELRDAIDRSRARFEQLHHPEAASEGRLVVVFSTKGGCGKSFIAANLAVALAERIEDGIGLIDLSLTSGDLAIMLQLLPAWSVHDAALQGPRLDHQALRGFLTEHQSGVRLLAAPTDPALAEQVTAEAVQHLLALMRSLFPVTIIDTPSTFTEQVLAAIDLANEIILVGSLDVPSVKNLKLALQTLEALHIRRDSIRIVLGRSDSSVGLRVGEVERSLGTDVDVEIPSSRDVPLSINQGTPLIMSKKRSSVVSAIGRLADGTAQHLRTIDNDATARRRFLGRR